MRAGRDRVVQVQPSGAPRSASGVRVKSDAEKPNQPSEEGSEPARWRPRYDGDRSSWRADAGPQCGTSTILSSPSAFPSS